MDIIYEVLDAFHVFIPVVAIVACVIIFVCGIRSSKSAQPPDEYLQEIKNASKNKIRHKTTKLATQTSTVSSSKADLSPVSEKITPKSSPSTTAAADATRREKTKPTETSVKKPKKLSKKDSDENESLEIVETSEWVTVTPKRKQQKDGPILPAVTSSSPFIAPTIPDTNIAPETVSKKPIVVSDEDEKSDKPTGKMGSPKKSPEKKKVEKKSVEKSALETEQGKGGVENAGVEPTKIVETQKQQKTLDEAIEEDESWSVQTGKDSRYRKSKKRDGPKNDIIANDGDNFSNSHTVSSPLSDDSGGNQQSSETRRRRNVRREN